MAEEYDINALVAEVKGMLQSEQGRAKALGLGPLAFLLGSLLPLLYLPDEYVEDVWMINQLISRLQKFKGTAKIPKPYPFTQWDVTSSGYNGKEFVFQVLAKTKIPHPNMVYIYGDVAQPIRVIFNNANDEESLTVKLSSIPGRIYFDWYIDKNAIRTAQAETWEEISKAIQDGNVWKALGIVFNSEAILHGYRPEDVQMSPDIVPLSPGTGLKLETDPMTQSVINDVEDATKNIGKGVDEVKATLNALGKLEEWHSTVKSTEYYEYKTTPLDDLMEGLEKGDVSKILSAEEALKESINIGGKAV